MNQETDYIQRAYDIFQERLLEIFKNAPQSEISYLQKYDFTKILSQFQGIRNKDTETQKFAANLFIQASKCFETYGKNENGEDRFPFAKYIPDSCQDQGIFYCIFTINFFQKSDISFKPFDLDHILNKAKKCIKKNIDIVSQILNENITIEELEQFLNDQKVLIFVQDGDGIQNIIQGLSSIDGKSVYISHSLIEKYKSQENYDEGEVNLNNSFDSDHSELYWNHFRKIQWAIEHHMMENITKYFSQQIDHKSISPERNPNLIVYGDYMVGSGRFFEKKAHNRKFNQQNPLILNKLKNYQTGFY
ncbi:hypothetical protein pb186bvf_000882 [Paramecium bursaria]